MEKQWQVVENDKEKVVLVSPNGVRIKLTEMENGHIAATIEGIEPMHEVKFGDKVWDALDRLSEKTPEHDSDEDM